MINKYLLVVVVIVTLGWPQYSQADSDFCDQLKSQLQEGDLVFIGIPNPVMKAVSEATNSWANHLGIVFHTEKDQDWRVFESILMSTGDRSFCSFIKRAKTGQIALLRLKQPLDKLEMEALWQALQLKIGTAYDASFNLKSRGQYCSKLVYQIFKEALGIEIGEVETFKDVYRQAGKNGRKIFRYWFWRGVPWERTTVTPRSQLKDSKLKTVWSWQQK